MHNLPFLVLRIQRRLLKIFDKGHYQQLAQQGITAAQGKQSLLKSSILKEKKREVCEAFCVPSLYSHRQYKQLARFFSKGSW